MLIVINFLIFRTENWTNSNSVAVMYMLCFGLTTCTCWNWSQEGMRSELKRSELLSRDCNNSEIYITESSIYAFVLFCRLL